MNKFDLCDSVSVIITDQVNLLCFVNPNEANVVDLITFKIPQQVSWMQILQKYLNELLGESVAANNLDIFKMCKIWIPFTGDTAEANYIINIVIMVKVDPEFKYFFVIPNSGKFANLKWLNEHDIDRFYNLNVISTPLLLDIFPEIKLNPREYPIGMKESCNFLEVTKEFVSKDTGSIIVDQLLEEYSVKASLESWYVKFLKTIFPNVLMSCGHFCKILKELGFSKSDAQYIFNAADIKNRHFLSFREFLGIATALEPKIKHVGAIGRGRTFYIFRYLNRTNDGKITLIQTKELVILLRKSRQLSIDASNIEKDLKATATALNITKTHPISCEEFLKSADEMKMRGIANIFRATKSILQSNLGTSKPPTSGKQLGVVPSMSGFNFIPPSVERVVKDTVQWQIATHSVRIAKSGEEISLEPIFNSNICSDEELKSANITEASRKQSLDNVSPTFLCNDLLDQIKELANINEIRSGNRGNKDQSYSWGTLNSKTFAQKLISAAQMAKQILDKEPRLLIVSSPVYILGDLHGNFGDVLYFEKSFWPLNPAYNPTSVLFLGDYVDRGWYSVEVSTYILCNKILYPNKIFLVRGNHEIRDVQINFTFLSECKSKFGDSLGNALWDAINDVFDYMPLAAVIDNKIFCCHGGIPPPWLCPTAAIINQIPKPLVHPDNISALAWELLWNDPVGEKDITNEMLIEMAACEGFAANPKRGTAHVFGIAATIAFLETHNFTHIIRAHEFAMPGFEVFHNGKVLTVFSSSKYENSDNESACILVENLKLQIIRLVPSNIQLELSASPPNTDSFMESNSIVHGTSIS